mgnify:CR=1 FL=1
MAFIGTFSRALLESATAVYFGGVSVSILDAQGNVILGDDLPDAPTVTSTIAYRTYVVGDAAVTVDLRTKFSGATSYTVSPTNAAVTIDGYTLTINPAAAMTSTSFAVRGVNGGGSSEPLAFTLTVTAPVPVLLQPFPDQSLLIGGGTVTLPLAEYFSGATGYAVSPANNGVTISNGNLIISRTTARDVIITVTATNATGQDTSDSFALLIAAPANQAPVASAIPQQTPTANTAFSVDLSSYFVDPEGAALSFDYTGTLPTGITRNGAVFSGTATVTDQTASGVLRARDPGNLEAEAPVTWAVSAQPTITATIDLQPAGQQSSITFNVAIDGSPTIAQGSTSITATRVGTTNQWTFTAPVEGPISFAATKAGYTAFSDASRSVAPALSALIERDYEIMLQGDPGSEPVEIIEPQEYAASYVTPNSSLTNGMATLAASVISRTGDTITATRDPLFTWDDSIEPVQFGWAYYRGTTSQTAILIAGTEDAASYTVDPALDGGKNVYRRDWIENAEGAQVVAFSNGIAVAAAAGWWTPDSIADVDFQNNRARINGVSYASIAEARTANAIKTSAAGVDYVDVSNLPASYVLAGKGIASLDSRTQVLAALDDGDDAVTNDEIAYIGQRDFGTTGKSANAVITAGNSTRLSATSGITLTPDQPVRLALRVKSGSSYLMANGQQSFATTTAGAQPAVTRLTLGKRSVTDHLAWVGALHRVVLITADLTNDQINALLA